VTVEVLPDAAALAARAAALFAAAAQEAAAARGRFAVALSGGETPSGLFRELARQTWVQKVPWRRAAVYWVDERCVPPDHPRSNYGLAWSLLLRHLALSPAQVHRMRGEDPPAAAAAACEEELRELAGRERPPQPRPVFDLVLLGLGGDGHTASLFPHSPALAERERLCLPVTAPDGEPRLTLTLPVLNAARRVWFLVSGTAKAGIVAEVLEGLRLPQALPAQAVAPATGELRWLLDAAAAAALRRPATGFGGDGPVVQ
jgi:6-phosphogluconolactonase